MCLSPKFKSDSKTRRAAVAVLAMLLGTMSEASHRKFVLPQAERICKLALTNAGNTHLTSKWSMHWWKLPTRALAQMV